MVIIVGVGTHPLKYPVHHYLDVLPEVINENADDNPNTVFYISTNRALDIRHAIRIETECVIRRFGIECIIQRIVGLLSLDLYWLRFKDNRGIVTLRLKCWRLVLSSKCRRRGVWQSPRMPKPKLITSALTEERTRHTDYKQGS